MMVPVLEDMEQRGANALVEKEVLINKQLKTMCHLLGRILYTQNNGKNDYCDGLGGTGKSFLNTKYY